MDTQELYFRGADLFPQDETEGLPPENYRPPACSPEVFLPVGGLLEMPLRTRYSPSKSYANCPDHPSLGQKRFNPALNLLIPTSANTRCGIVVWQVWQDRAWQAWQDRALSPGQEKRMMPEPEVQTGNSG